MGFGRLVFAFILLHEGCSLAAPAKKQSVHKSMHQHQMAAMSQNVLKAMKSVPSIVSIATHISAIELQAPPFRTVENMIESYYKDHSGIVEAMEQGYEHHSKISNMDKFEEVTKAHPKLAHAVSELVSVESDHQSLAVMQSSLQKAMKTNKDIITDLECYTEMAYPAAAAAAKVVEKADITDPHIVSAAVHAQLVMAESASVENAFHELSAQEFTIPKTIDDQIKTFIAHPSVIQPAVLASLASCYPNVYSEAEDVEKFIAKHKTAQSAVEQLISAAETVKSIETDVVNVVKSEEPSVVDYMPLMNSMEQSWPSGSMALTFEETLLASNKKLDNAAHVIQESLYHSPEIAYSLLVDIQHPSAAKNPKQMMSEEESHESLVKALAYENSWMDDHPSYASAIQKLGTAVVNEAEKHSNLVSAQSRLHVQVSSSVAAASVSLAKVRQYVPSIATVMESFEKDAVYSPSITCAESTIARYDTSMSTMVVSMWDDLTHPSDSKVNYLAEITAKYPHLHEAFMTIMAAAKKFPSLESVESALVIAQKTDPYLTSQWKKYKESRSSMLKEMASS